MKLKQLLISTVSIAALAVVPMSIVSCGNNNNNAVEGLPPANGGDNNNSNPGGSTGGSNNGGENSTPGEDNNNQPGGSTGGSNNGGNNNNQPGWDVDPSSKYINVNSRDGMAAYILANSDIASEFIKKALNRPYKTVPFSHQWTDKLTSLVYDKGMITTKDNNYTYYNVKSITFTYAGGAIINYQFYENNTLQKGIISTRDGGVITLSVDLKFRSKKDFIGGLSK